VDALHDRFVALVARQRNLSPEAVRATEAGVYRGDLAVQAGLADAVGTLRQAVAQLAGTFSRTSIRSRPSPRKEASMSDPEPVAEVAIPAPGPTAQETVPPAVDPAALEQRLRAEYADLAAVAAQAARLGVRIDAAEAMAKGIRPDALRRSVLEELAARSEAADLVAAAPPPGARPAGESPIVRRAKEAASRS
jgi:ClpP class serine protease